MLEYSYFDYLALWMKKSVNYKARVHCKIAVREVVKQKQKSNHLFSDILISESGEQNLNVGVEHCKWETSLIVELV